jgi:hypothetical protein
MNSDLELSHLEPSVAQICLLDDQARIDHIRKDRFIAYAQAENILAELEILMHLDDAVRPQGRLLAGRSLMGKSTIVAEFMRKHAADDNASGDVARVPVVCVQYPESASGNLYGEILAALNATLPSRARVQELRAACVDLLRNVGMRILLVDEFHNILEGSTSAQTKALNSIKYLMNELHRPLVVIGTEQVIIATEKDRQISSRLRVLPLRRFMFDDDFCDLLAAFEVILPLRKASNLYEPKLAKLIHEHTNGITGDVADLLNAAAIMAIETGTEQITAEEVNALKDRIVSVMNRTSIENLLG